MPAKKIIVNRALNWPSINLSEATKSVFFQTDDEGNIQAVAVIPIDPTGTTIISGVRANKWVYNNITNNSEIARTPTVWKTGSGLTSTTTIWTPAATAKIRVMGGFICLSKDAACAGAFAIGIYDAAAAANVVNFQISNAALVATGQTQYFPFSFPENGYLQPVIGQVFQAVISAALTAGSFSVGLWGCEET